MSEQIGFLFDAPLVDIPPPQVIQRIPRPSVAPPPASRSEQEKQEFEERVRTAIVDMGKDDISSDEVLVFMGLPEHSIVGWHRSRVLAVVAAPFSDWQTYAVGPIAKKVGDKPTVWRHRRLAPLVACPGYDGAVCGSPTRGGKLCHKCEALESAELSKNDPQAPAAPQHHTAAPEDDIEPFAPLQEEY